MPDENETAVNETVNAGLETEELPPSKKRGIGIAAWIAIVWLVVVALSAIFANWLPIPSVDARFPEIAKSGPSVGHWFGGDRNGKDILSMTVNGSRVSLLVGFVAVALGMTLGGFLGIVAGFLRGWVDKVLSIVFDTLLAIPGVLLALALVATLDPADVTDIEPTRRMWVLTFALGVVSVPILGRIARASTLMVVDREFVLAARALGAKPWRIMAREILPNVMPSMLSIGLLGVGVAIVAEGGLALLGASVTSPLTSWGSLIAVNGGEVSAGRPWSVFGPSIFIFATVMSLNYLGDVVRKRFDVRDSVI